MKEEPVSSSFALQLPDRRCMKMAIPKLGWQVGCLTSYPSNMLVYLREGSAQTVVSHDKLQKLLFHPVTIY